MTESTPTPRTVGYRLSLETPDGSRRFVLRAGVNVVGTYPSCGVCLRGRGVSRRHATITHEGGEPRLADLGSQNGTTRGLSRLAARRATSL